MKLAYFVHELGVAQSRVRMLKAGGAKIELFGFERRDFPKQADAQTSTHVLGRTKSGGFIARVFSVLGAIPKALSLRAAWRSADAVIARNLEMLAIVRACAALLRLRPRIVYEVRDIHRLMLGKGALHAAMRALERFLMRPVALVLTTSPAFEREYFRALQRFAGDIMVVEHRLLPVATPSAAPSSPIRTEPPWRILWCGVLRCRKSLEIFTRLLARGDAGFELALWGMPALDQMPDFHEIVARTPGMSFHGPYRADDLPRIYADADFVWLFVSQGRARAFMYWSLFRAITSIAAFVIGLRWGAVGVAAAYALSDVGLRLPVLWWWASREGPVRLRDLASAAAPFAAAALVSGGALLLLARAPFPNVVIELGVSVLVSYLVSGAVIWLFPEGRRTLRDGIRVVVAESGRFLRRRPA